MLKESLSILGAGRMMVAHTRHPSIPAFCEEQALIQLSSNPITQ